MFKNVFVEAEIQNHPNTLHILSKIKKEVTIIDNIDDYWQRVKKPYLQKRDNLNLFIGSKKGQLVKKTPDAYGTKTGDHYYFIHAYNCIYECQYCYLQGHFNSPDLVLFVNHDEIIEQMQKIVDESNGNEVWFHSGEFSDSLALSHITNELPQYFEFFKKNENAFLEIRTKSVNIRELQKLSPLKNVIVSFSLASEFMGKNLDEKCPSVKARIMAMETLAKKGFTLGVHFDPIVYEDDFKNSYSAVIEKLFTNIKNEQIYYVSIGVVRFTKSDYQEVKNNYPNGQIFAQDFVKSFDDKIRYNRPMRKWILNTVKNLLVEYVDESKIYQCMED